MIDVKLKLGVVGVVVVERDIVREGRGSKRIV